MDHIPVYNASNPPLTKFTAYRINWHDSRLGGETSSYKLKLIFKIVNSGPIGTKKRI